MTGMSTVVALIALLLAVVEGVIWFFAAGMLKTLIARTPAVTLARIGLAQASVAAALLVWVFAGNL